LSALTSGAQARAIIAARPSDQLSIICRSTREEVRMRWLRGLAALVAVIAILMLVLAGPGTRFGVWNFRIGLSLLRYAAYLGIAAVFIALIALVMTRPRGTALGLLLGALLLASVAFLGPWAFLQKAKKAPAIHDITTDTSDPPLFVAVLPLRKDAVNPPTYGGDSVAAQQRRAYPDIGPLELHVPPDQAFERALAAARAMGWDIDATDHAAGRIEATATTKWFGFKDDIVVRIRPEGAGSRVDVRSVSRVGKSDLGTNAARVRAYLARLASS
jgi:uncharacterized protein (DUF1499 family)